jgi:hypothetical protein
LKRHDFITEEEFEELNDIGWSEPEMKKGYRANEDDDANDDDDDADADSILNEETGEFYGAFTRSSISPGFMQVMIQNFLMMTVKTNSIVMKNTIVTMTVIT